MATETLPPTAIASETNQTGAVTAIDEDPDSSGGDFLDAGSNNVNTACLVDFATPTGPPTVGADDQEFRIQVKEYDNTQSGTPEARIELWENGGLIRAGSNVDVTTDDQVLSFTWNANELATADGSLVQCNFVGTKAGGAPGARNTTDLGAVEWNVTYTAAPSVVDNLLLETGVDELLLEDGVDSLLLEENQAAPSGRIMSSLVGAGGMAGHGGMAGQGGGLAG